MRFIMHADLFKFMNVLSAVNQCHGDRLPTSADARALAFDSSNNAAAPPQPQLRQRCTVSGRGLIRNNASNTNLLLDHIRW